MWRNEKQAEGNFLYDCRLPLSFSAGWTHTPHARSTLTPHTARVSRSQCGRHISRFGAAKNEFCEKEAILRAYEKIKYSTSRLERERKRVRDRCRNVASACLLFSPIAFSSSALSLCCWISSQSQSACSMTSFFTIHPFNCNIENLCWWLVVWLNGVCTLFWSLDTFL